MPNVIAAFFFFCRCCCTYMGIEAQVSNCYPLSVGLEVYIWGNLNIMVRKNNILVSVKFKNYLACTEIKFRVSKWPPSGFGEAWPD